MFETEPRLGRSLDDNGLESFLKKNFGAKYLVFVSSRSFKMRELNFAQFLYFFREVCLFFSF
jgi:hypothetical protein